MKWLCGKITHGYFFVYKKGCRIKQQPESVKISEIVEHQGRPLYLIFN